MAISQSIKDLIELAWADGHVCLLGTVGADGPNISPKGSMIFFDDDHLAYWERSKRKALVNLGHSKRVVVVYSHMQAQRDGRVESPATPRRNVSATASRAGSESPKCMQALRTIVPGSRSLAILAVSSVRRNVAGEEIQIRDRSIEAPAVEMGIEIRIYPVAAPEDLEGAFKAILRDRSDALMCEFTAMTFRERQRVIDFANRNGLPSMFGAWPFVRDGGLIAYAASRRWMFVHSFAFADRLLRGARPAELPVELPTRFELLINLKTARALGLAVPESLLVRADQVVE